MTSRYIPNEISKAVKERHFFECAWCGEKLTERHHIDEFAKGGQHTVENLILLCPNCHTQVHNNEISTEELIKRKSNHTKGDHLAGGVQFDLKQPFVKLGMGQFRNVPILLMYKEEALITLKEFNEEFFLSTRFYNKTGDLIFWMSSNRYWTSSDFYIQSKKGELIIINNEDENNNLRIWQNNDTLNVEGKIYVGGMLVNLNPMFIQFGTSNPNTFNGINVSNCQVGIWID
jgi:hypothetical protein